VTAPLDLRTFFDGDVRPDDAAATTEAFRRADLALAAAGGGTLEVPPGRWVVRALERDRSTAILLRTPGTTLRGAGVLATTIALEAGQDCHVIVVVVPGTTIERLHIVGGLQHQPAEVHAGRVEPARRSHGISLRECPSYALVRDVLIEDVVGYGIGSIIVRGGDQLEPDPFTQLRLHNVTLRRIGDDAIDFKIDVDHERLRPGDPDPAAMGHRGPRAFVKNISVVDHSVLGPCEPSPARGENGIDGRGQLHIQNVEVLRIRPGAWGKQGGAGITLRDETRPGGGISSASHGRGGQWSTVQNYHLTIRAPSDLRDRPGVGLIVTPTIRPVVSVTNGNEVELGGGHPLAPAVTLGKRMARSAVARVPRPGRYPVPEARTFAELEPTLAKGDFTFIDFGGGFGASLAYYQREFGGRGLGIEIEPHKVDAARAKGRGVVEGSLFDVPRRPLVRYVTADNVLEHMDSIEQVEEALALAAAVADEFIYVRHPSFEDEDYLRSLGVSGTWVHRSGHRAHVRLSDFLAMATRLGIDRVEIHPAGLIRDTSDPEIVPIGTPKNDLTYDPETHDPRPEVTFDRQVFYAYDILFHLARRPSVRLVYEQDPITTRTRPFLAREIGPLGWRRPTVPTTVRTTRRVARSVGHQLPMPVRSRISSGLRRLR
jgi:hypothetical protein